MPCAQVISRRSTVPLPSGELPTSFPIFRPDRSGRIATTEGVDIFDAEAARETLRRYREQKNRLCLDLEHMSLGGTGRDASNALAWFDLEMRGADLWAVRVSFTPEGERRLRDRSQVYVSPAFRKDANGRIVELINCGLVAMPATFGATQLVAASKLGAKTSGTITTRLPFATRNRVLAAARRWGASPGEYLRILATAATSKNPERILRVIAQTLGLEKDAPAAEVSRVLAELIAGIDADIPSDPTAAASDPPAPGSTADLIRGAAKRRRDQIIARLEARIAAHEAIPPKIRAAGPAAIARWNEIAAQRARERARQTRRTFEKSLKRK